MSTRGEYGSLYHEKIQKHFKNLEPFLQKTATIEVCWA